MTLPITVMLALEESQQQYSIDAVETNIPVSVQVETNIVTSTTADYDGDYDITPSAIQQVFSTEGKRVLHDFIVEPIPNNYGLITYNGSIITVS